MFNIKSFISVLLVTKRCDVIDFFKKACGPEVYLKVEQDFSKISSSISAFLIFDATLFSRKDSSFYSFLDFFTNKKICILPQNLPSSISLYAESKFDLIIPFPVSIEILRRTLNRVFVSIQNKNHEKNQLCEKTEFVPDSFSGLFCGSSEKILFVRKQIVRAANSCEPVLLLGETGTGKSSAAGEIHRMSVNRHKSMIKKSFTTIVDSLAESTFFGYAKGSFTGAENDGIGLLESADGNTLFLDELGHASLAVQALLLPVLDHEKIKKLGDEKERSVNVRFIFATNANIRQMIREGSFLMELYFRICNNIIVIPPLREHKEDIDDLVKNYFRGTDFKITEEALEFLKSYNWPGNIRELNLCLDSAMQNSANKIITPNDINFGYFSFPQ